MQGLQRQFAFSPGQRYFLNLLEINWSFQPHEYGKSFLWTWPTCAYSQTGLNYVKTRFLLKFLLNGWVYVKHGLPQTLNAIKESIMRPAVPQRSFKMNSRPGKVAHFHYSVLYKVNQITNVSPLLKKRHFGDKNGERPSRLSLCQKNKSARWIWHVRWPPAWRIAMVRAILPAGCLQRRTGGELTSCGSRHRGLVSASAVWNELLDLALIAALTHSPEFSGFFSFPHPCPEKCLFPILFLLRLVSSAATEALGGDPEGDVTAENAGALIKTLARQVPVPPSLELFIHHFLAQHCHINWPFFTDIVSRANCYAPQKNHKRRGVTLCSQRWKTYKLKFAHHLLIHK